MLRNLPLFCSAILTSLTLVACSTTSTLTPAQRSRIHRIGVTTSLVDTDVTAARVGITVFGNNNSLFSSSRLGLPEAVDKAIAGNLRGFNVVALSSAESHALRAKLESIPDHGIFNMDEKRTATAKFVSEAAKDKNLDAVLVVRPGLIFVHDKAPVGHGYMVFKYLWRTNAIASLQLLLCEPKTGKLLADAGAISGKELQNLSSWESAMGGDNPEVKQALLECSEKAANKGMSQLGF